MTPDESGGFIDWSVPDEKHFARPRPMPDNRKCAICDRPIKPTNETKTAWRHVR